MEEFTQRYGVAEDGKYVITRDIGTYAILKEVEAGRGSPHGGVYLSFQHCPENALRESFGPVIDRLAANGIDWGWPKVQLKSTSKLRQMSEVLGAVYEIDMRDCICLRASESNDKLNS